MNYSGIIYNDIANGPGIRTSLFVSGCRNHCEGCFNKEQQDFNYGEEFNEKVENKIMDSIDNQFFAGISILGGDPLEPENAEVLLGFLKRFKHRFIDKTIWMYTGYLYEDIINLKDDDPRKMILKYIDVLVDGPFILSKKDISLKFKGSSNQRIINVKKSLIRNAIYTI